MKTRIFIKVRFGAIFRLTTVIFFLMIVFTTPGYADDLFEYQLDAGIGRTKSVLESQGYSVKISKDLTYVRLSSIEIFNFKNEYLNKMHLWINCYKGRVFTYKWEGVIMADVSGAANIERLLQYISNQFGEPEVPAGMKTRVKQIDASQLKTIVTGDGSDELHFIWEKNEKQVEMFLSVPLLPLNDMEVDLTLRYFLPRIEKEVSAYKYGK